MVETFKKAIDVLFNLMQTRKIRELNSKISKLEDEQWWLIGKLADRTKELLALQKKVEIESVSRNCADLTIPKT
jgi:hypothetical protein